MMNLEKLGLSLEDVLQRSQLVSISGGIGPGDPALDDGGTCGYRDTTGYVVCNLSRDQAEGYANDYGGNWCCDSCGSASYC